MEFGYVYNAYGSAVTIVEGMPRILPQEDEEVSQALARALTKLGMKVLAGSMVTKVAVGGAMAEVEIDTPDGKLSLSARPRARSRRHQAKHRGTRRRERRSDLGSRLRASG